MTLDKSAGIDLYEISPHSSDNSHTELYETMFSEYALGTARFAASKNNGGVSAYRQFEEMQKNIIRPNLRYNGTKEKGDYLLVSDSLPFKGDHKWHIKYIEIISLYALIF